MPESEQVHEQIFLSYAREDKPLATKIVEFLESIGFTVFWDLDIRCGTDFRKKLELKLECVKAIFVLWSSNSVTSEWVLNEAEFGRSRQVLVAASIDNCKLPFGFRLLWRPLCAGAWSATSLHLMFGILALTVGQLFRLVT